MFPSSCENGSCELKASLVRDSFRLARFLMYTFPPVFKPQLVSRRDA